jgi:hypothetical protein
MGPARIAGAFHLLWLAGYGGASAQVAGPFARLAGQWSGNGTIELSDGTREPIRCKAAYDALDRSLQLNIRCASESYGFDLRSSVKYSSGGNLTGTWSEDTRNFAGTISGRASGDRFQVAAQGPSFSANLTVITHGDRQSVVIQPDYEKASVKRAAITLQRGS